MQVCFNEKGSRTCNNGADNSDQEIYVYMIIGLVMTNVLLEILVTVHN